MPQTFDYMGALRAGYSVKEIQQATKDIDIHNALEQWGRKFFQKQAKQPAPRQNLRPVRGLTSQEKAGIQGSVMMSGLGTPLSDQFDTTPASDPSTKSWKNTPTQGTRIFPVPSDYLP